MNKEPKTTGKQKNKNGNKYIPINNYFNCQWTKCSKQNNTVSY